MGIFRQSANHRKVKETKEAIDNSEWRGGVVWAGPWTRQVLTIVFECFM